MLVRRAEFYPHVEISSKFEVLGPRNGRGPTSSKPLKVNQTLYTRYRVLNRIVACLSVTNGHTPHSMLHMRTGTLINHGRTKQMYICTGTLHRRVPAGSMAGRATSAAAPQDAAPSITSNLPHRAGAVAPSASGVGFGCLNGSASLASPVARGRARQASGASGRASRRSRCSCRAVPTKPTSQAARARRAPSGGSTRGAARPGAPGAAGPRRGAPP